MNKASLSLKAILAVLAVLGARLIGDWTVAMTTLVIFISLDFATGIARGIIQKKLSSEISFRGILKKLVIGAVVVVGHQIDILLGGTEPIFRNAVTVYYCVSEAISILENVAGCDVGIPSFLTDILAKLSPDKLPGPG